MRDAECVPEHDVGVVDTGVAVGDPFGDSARGLARGLGDVPSGGEDLLVVVFCDVHSVAGEACTFPYQGSWFRKKAWNFSADQLVAHWFVAVRVEFVGIYHVPCPRSSSIVIAERLFHSAVRSSLRIEGVSVRILFATDLACALCGVDLDDGIIWSVNIGVDS